MEEKITNEEVKNEVEVQSDEIQLEDSKLAEIKAEAARLKKTLGLRRVLPLIVAGDEYDDKELYVAYFKEPSFKIFSKFQAIGAKDAAVSVRGLAKDCFIGGDRELIDDESLFCLGTMQYILSIVNVRRGRIVNLSKAGN